MTTDISALGLRAISDRATNAAYSAYSQLDFLAHGPDDVLALVAEVQRLRSDVVSAIDAEGFDTYGGGNDVHYRVYRDRDGKPVVISVQDFDYPDYDESKFVTDHRHATEASANRDIALFLASA